MTESAKSLVDVLQNLRRCVDEAEHEPGRWASARSEMGGITTAHLDAEADASRLLDPTREQTWAGFSFKRDSWLAVEAVNALPMLMALAERVLERAALPGEAGAGCRAILDGPMATQASISGNDRPSSDRPGEDGGDAGDEPSTALVECESEGAQMIVAERRRQQCVKGWTAQHDDEHTDQSMAVVCALYASPIQLYEQSGRPGSFHFVDPWPKSWSGEWDKRRVNTDGSLKKRSVDELIRDLTKAGALAAAEIDRHLRKKRSKRAGRSAAGES